MKDEIKNIILDYDSCENGIDSTINLIMDSFSTHLISMYSDVLRHAKDEYRHPTQINAFKRGACFIMDKFDFHKNNTNELTKDWIRNTNGISVRLFNSLDRITNVDLESMDYYEKSFCEKFIYVDQIEKRHLIRVSGIGNKTLNEFFELRGH